LDRLLAEALGELGPVEAGWFHRFVQGAPIAVADELAPAANGPVLGRWRSPAGHDRSGALPQHGIRGRPADSLVRRLAIRQGQAAAVQRDIVVENPGRPALDRPAEGVS